MLHHHEERAPLRRNVSPEDVANVITFLAGPDASYLAGETIEISFEVARPIPVSELSVLETTWSIIYEFPNVLPMEITGKHTW